jgi:hypothetical protein
VSLGFKCDEVDAALEVRSLEPCELDPLELDPPELCELELLETDPPELCPPPELAEELDTLEEAE